MIGRREEESRAWHIARLVTVVVCLMAGTAATTLAVVQFASADRAQPLEITACTPDSYNMPAPIDEAQNVWERGTVQADCERWFVPANDTWPADEPIRVLGQTCLDGDDSVAYEVSVAFESVDNPGLRLPVIDVPVTYEPGCQAPYDFPFEFPLNAITEAAGDGESLGDWRIVGRAEPVNFERYLPYQWDATETVEIVNP